ncbi:MAG: hypothetical protein PHY30_00675 [Candidatus Pacebacteria bacterium]|nr:hypothetical protein [Candidatus Paceibacterota bacterium]
MNKNIIILVPIVAIALIIFMANKSVPAPEIENNDTREQAFIEEIMVWPNIQSFDLEDESFEGNIWTKDQSIKILSDDSIKIYRTSGPQWEKEYFNFSEFYSLIGNWEGPTWPFHVKGFYAKENIFKAEEIFLITQ